MQYFSQRQNESINRLIEEAILEAEEKGARVISLGLLNQVSIYVCVRSFHSSSKFKLSRIN